jgi:hypothetical protein
MLSWRGQGEFHLSHRITKHIAKIAKVDQERDAKPGYRIRVHITQLALKNCYFSVTTISTRSR